MRTIVQLIGEQKENKCGYCNSPNTSQFFGMWAHSLTIQDYQNLLDRGFSITGKYLYLPTNHVTCCPQYTISCDAGEFKLSKSQKKILRKFNNYLMTPPSNNSTQTQLTLEVTDKKSKDQKIDPQKNDDPATPNSNPNKIFPISSTPNLKAKARRLEKKRLKLIDKGCQDMTSKCQMSTPKKEENLEDLITPKPSLTPHKKFVIKTIKVGTPEFQENFQQEFDLYKIYQFKVHDRNEETATTEQFTRVLCDSPFLQTDQEDNYGRFHQLYYIENSLIAVGVIDILPNCVSSVNFLYDPEYSFLNLGTYSALREIALVRQLNKTYPKIKYYYMGYYIESCPKMSYKSNYKPSYLLCPEQLTWHLLDDDMKTKLAVQKYQRLDPSPPKTDKDEEPINLDNVQILQLGQGQDSRSPFTIVNSWADDKEEILQKFSSLVGDQCTKSMVVYLDDD